MITSLVALSPVFLSALVFFTGAPEPTKDAGVAPVMNPREYRAFVQSKRFDNSFVFIRKTPANLSSNALYGLNFVVGNKNRSWILDGSDASGWVLYLDWNGNGDLSKAKPQRLERVNGSYWLNVQVKDGDLRYPCHFEVTHEKLLGKETIVVDIGDGTVRRGVIEIGGKKAPFALLGAFGRYDWPYETLTINQNGSSEPEHYQIRERYFNLFGKSYEFRVHPRGDSIRLTQLAVARPDRPSLKVGSTAPEFAGVDTRGIHRSLESYRGRLLLLDFMYTSCSPCRRDAPHLATLYKTTQRGQLELLSVPSADTPETLQHFLKQFDVEWPQILESNDGVLNRLYRVQGYPTYFLVGRKGEILATWIGSGKVEHIVSNFLTAP
jgi:peroxiredoxin